MRSSLALLVLLAMPTVSLAEPEAANPPEAPPVPAPDAGIEATLRARVLFDQSDFRGAALEYEQAVQLLAHGPRWNAALNNLAVCYERVHAYDEALVSYERYLREANPTVEDRAEVERIVRGLRDLLAELHVSSDQPAEVWVDERARGHTPLSLRLTAGRHVVELRAPGHRDERRSVSLRARSLENLRVTLQREERYRGVHRGYFYSGVGLTAVALAVGAGLGIRALTAHDDGKRLATEGLATTDDVTHIERLQLSADIAFGSAALLGASSLVLAFLTDWTTHGETPRASRLSVVGVAPLARERGGVLVLGGVL